MDVEIFSLCDFAQESSGKMNLLGVFDVIFSNQFPMKQSFSIAARIRFENDEIGHHDFKVSFINADTNKEVSSLTGGLDVQKNDKSNEIGYSQVNIPLRAHQYEFKEPGKYWVKLFIDGKEVRKRPLNLVKRD